MGMVLSGYVRCDGASCHNLYEPEWVSVPNKYGRTIGDIAGPARAEARKLGWKRVPAAKFDDRGFGFDLCPACVRSGNKPTRRFPPLKPLPRDSKRTRST